MLRGSGRYMGMQQDTTHTQAVGDTLTGKVQDTLRRDTARQKSSTPRISLDNLENLFRQTDRRLKKDSIAAVKKIRPAVKKTVVKKTLQDPADSIRFMFVTAHRPDNSPREILLRSFSAQNLLEVDSTRDYYQPLYEKRSSPVTRPVTVQTVTDTAIKREPAFLRENWILGVLILAFLLITWTKIRFGKLLNQTIRALWNYKSSNALFRNKSALYQGTAFLLTFNFFITGTLFVYLFLKAFYPAFFPSDFPPLRIYLYIFLALAGVYLYFMIMLRMTNFITLAGEPLSEYLHFTKLFFQNAGLYLFPLVAVIPYVYEPVARRLLWAGVAVVSVLYLFRIVKLIIIFIHKRFSIFFMILYLCALEILPVALLLKYLFR